MKFLIVFALIAAVASAAVKPTPISGELAEIQEIIAAIQSPSTDPATAAALEEMLQEALGINTEGIEGIEVGPAIIEHEPISVGPAVIDAMPEGVVAPAGEAANSPLVQIIVNINQAALEPSSPVIGPEPIEVIETAPIAVNPVGVSPMPVDPVQVVETAPVPAEPVIIGTPVLPAPAVTLPEELN